MESCFPGNHNQGLFFVIGLDERCEGNYSRRTGIRDKSQVNRLHKLRDKYEGDLFERMS